MAGYHVKEIKRGTYGDISKVTEEYFELMDACEQLNPVMALQEMSDLIGAIEGLAKNYNISLKDLIRMKKATKRAFKDGTRKPR